MRAESGVVGRHLGFGFGVTASRAQPGHPYARARRGAGGQPSKVSFERFPMRSSLPDPPHRRCFSTRARHRAQHPCSDGSAERDTDVWAATARPCPREKETSDAETSQPNRSSDIIGLVPVADHPCAAHEEAASRLETKSARRQHARTNGGLRQAWQPQGWAIDCSGPASRFATRGP